MKAKTEHRYFCSFYIIDETYHDSPNTINLQRNFISFRQSHQNVQSTKINQRLTRTRKERLKLLPLRIKSVVNRLQKCHFIYSRSCNFEVLVVPQFQLIPQLHIKKISQILFYYFLLITNFYPRIFSSVLVRLLSIRVLFSLQNF